MHRRWWLAVPVLGAVLLTTGVAGLLAAGDGTRSETVRVAGVPVEVVRPATGGTRRPAVVVVHGYAGSGRLMRPFADTLVRRGYVVALPDLAGHAANTRALTGSAVLGREIASVVGYLRARPEVDPARVALLGHSMGAAAVIRAGAADPAIPATVAISLGDDEAAAARPGPRRLLLVAGAWEPGGILATTRAAGRVEGRRVVTVPMVEHITVLFADRTHDEAARWFDDALGHRPDRAGVAAARRVGAGALVLAGALLAVASGLLARGRREHGPAPTRGRDRWLWLGGAVVAAPVVGTVGGLALARLLPATVSGYLVGYLGGAGATLLATDMIRRRVTDDPRRVTGDPRRLAGDLGDPADGPRPSVGDGGRLSAVATSVGLAVAATAAVVVPVHAGLTAMVPHGGHWWLIILLALATAALLAGAHTAGGPLWTMLVVVLVCLPLPVAAGVGLAPGFLVLIAPLVAILFAVHFVVVALAWRGGIPLWRTVAAGALVIAWPVATALPLG